MIFARSINGLSHCEQEYSTPEDLEAGANVLLRAALRLAGIEGERTSHKRGSVTWLPHTPDLRDLESIPEEHQGDRHEMIDGELVVTHRRYRCIRLSAEHLSDFDGSSRASGLGEVLYAPIDIRLTPDNVLIPDIIFIARDRLHIIGPKTIDAAPDLVVEILSPGNAAA